ncbi:MAG TPA: MarR family winged helix-turn-helix transcriptional regulator [Devosia sp.]|nr:MarR family winged helix-turn-helix transcriptional regulator [Devosia sp.]
MGKPRASSALYRLIEAGQLTRRALLVPLLEHGLEAGDDAVLLLLMELRQATESELSEALGMDAAAVGARVNRLLGRGFVERGPAAPALTLTLCGGQLCAALAESWAALEAALLEGLGKAERKSLRKRLGRFVRSLHP